MISRMNCSFVFSLVALGCSPLLSAEWPQWRGPSGEGHAPKMKLPAKWSETENVLWKTKTPGRGWSSPIIEGQRIWLTTAFETPADPDDAKERLKSNTGSQPVNVLKSVKLHVLALDVETGKLIDDIELLEAAEPQWVHQTNSYASPTPVFEEGKLYAHFGAYGTACLDTGTKKVLWRNTELRVNHENGPGSCPILWKDLLIFHMDGSDEQYLVALDKATGEVRWKTPRSGEMNENPQLKKGYGTPIVVSLGGSEQVLSNAADWLYGYDPNTGRELWKTPYGRLGFSNVPKIVTGHGMLFMCTGFMKSELYALKADGKHPAEIVWKYTRNVPTAPSPILVGEELYFISDQGGLITCLDAKTGDFHWRERAGGSKYWGSPLYGDGKLYFHSQDGRTLVLRPGKEFDLLAENQLDDEIMASSAAAHDSLFIRTATALYRIGEK